MKILICINLFQGDEKVATCYKIFEEPPIRLPQLGDHIELDPPYPNGTNPVVRKRTWCASSNEYDWVIEAKTESEKLFKHLVEKGAWKR